jgi:glycosyl-4,4'-diaponeurosporenoate acyltransferase
MRIIYLSSSLTVILVIIVWFVIHMAAALIGLKVPDRFIDPSLRIYRPAGWESGGRLYEKVFLVRKWKQILPDGGNWFRGGFAKRKLASVSPEYIKMFIRETCRAELTHWLAFFPALLFFFWVEWKVGLIMIGYGLMVNLPCIITQRYNRFRMERFLVRLSDADQRRGRSKT